VKVRAWLASARQVSAYFRDDGFVLDDDLWLWARESGLADRATPVQTGGLRGITAEHDGNGVESTSREKSGRVPGENRCGY